MRTYGLSRSSALLVGHNFFLDFLPSNFPDLTLPQSPNQEELRLCDSLELERKMDRKVWLEVQTRREQRSAWYALRAFIIRRVAEGSMRAIPTLENEFIEDRDATLYGLAMD